MAKKNGAISNLIMNIGFVLVLLFECFLLTISIPKLVKKNGQDSSVIVSGNANVELNYYAASGEYEELTDGVLFGGEWAPDTAQTVYLQIKNDSEYHIQCMLTLSADMGEMDGAFEYAAIEGAQANGTYLTWKDFAATQGVRDLHDGMNALNGQEYLYVAPNASAYVAFAVHMREESGNEYQNKSFVIDVMLLAAQV